MKRSFLTALLLTAIAFTSLSAAQWNTAQEEKNRALALDWMREVVMYRHVELAPKYMAADYKEHNPNIAVDASRHALTGFQKSVGVQPPLEITPNYKASLVLAAAKGDLVILVFDTVEPDPSNPSFNYTYTKYDAVRIANGKIVEHWDPTVRDPKLTSAAMFPSHAPGNPDPALIDFSKVNYYPSETPFERAAKAVALHWYHDCLLLHHAELVDKYMADDYIQHNPAVATGKAGFVQHTTATPARPLEPKWPNPLLFAIAQGDIVVWAFEHHQKDPHDASKIYDQAWFDMVRIENGKVMEHWDGAKLTPTRGREPALPQVSKK